MSSAKPGTTPKQKELLAVLDLVEWKATRDIATWLGEPQDCVLSLLKTLHRAGLVERKFDENLGRVYWKLPSGEQFHKASEEKK